MKTKQTDKNYMLKKKKKSRVQDKHYSLFPREYLWDWTKMFLRALTYVFLFFFFFLSACFFCLKLGIPMRLQQHWSSKKLRESLQQISFSFYFWVKIKSSLVGLFVCLFGLVFCVLFCFVLMQSSDCHLPDSNRVVLGPSWNWLFGVVMLGPLCL